MKGFTVCWCEKVFPYIIFEWAPNVFHLFSRNRTPLETVFSYFFIRLFSYLWWSFFENKYTTVILSKNSILRICWSSENLWFSNVFRGYRQRSVQWILTNFIDKKVTEHIFDEKLFHLMLVREKHCDNRLKIKWIIEKKNFKINEKLFKKFSVVIKKKNLEIFLKQSPRGVL